MHWVILADWQSGWRAVQPRSSAPTIWLPTCSCSELVTGHCECSPTARGLPVTESRRPSTDYLATIHQTKTLCLASHRISSLHIRRTWHDLSPLSPLSHTYFYLIRADYHSKRQTLSPLFAASQVDSVSRLAASRFAKSQDTCRLRETLSETHSKYILYGLRRFPSLFV